MEVLFLWVVSMEDEEEKKMNSSQQFSLDWGWERRVFFLLLLLLRRSRRFFFSYRTMLDQYKWKQICLKSILHIHVHSWTSCNRTLVSYSMAIQSRTRNWFKWRVKVEHVTFDQWTNRNPMKLKRIEMDDWREMSMELQGRDQRNENNMMMKVSQRRDRRKNDQKIVHSLEWWTNKWWRCRFNVQR